MRPWVAAVAMVALAGCAGAERSRRAVDRGLDVRATALRSSGGRAPAVVAPAPVGEVVRTELFVRCDDPTSCPSAVGMLVVEDVPGAMPERCTASLIGADRALTASHCLRPTQQAAGATCEGVWLSFPRTAERPAEAVGCTRVLSVTRVAREDGLQGEHALLQLERPLAREVLEVDARPLEADAIVTVASVTPHPVYGSTHALATRLCRTMGSERAQAALGPAAANVGWLSSCPIANGNSGSPVLDYDGKLRALVHGGTPRASALAVTSAPPH